MPIIKAERTERAGFTYSPARGVVAAPLLQRMSPGLHGECGPAILPHERRGPENSLPVPQIRALFLRLPAVRRKDGGQDPWLGCSLPSPNPPPSAPGRQSRVPRHGRTWVKLSGAYQDTKVGPPTYSDTVAVARAYIKAASERMVWASDWPHPTEKDKPDDAVLFDLLAEWAPDEAMRTRILVQNPATLYGFPASA